MISLILLSTLIFGMTTLGWSFINNWKIEKYLYKSEILCTSFLLGGLILSFFIWLVGIYSLNYISMLSLLIVVVSFGAWKISLNKKYFLRTVVDLAISFKSADFLTKGLFFLSALVMGLMIIQSWAPLVDADSLAYHFALPKRDVELGYIFVEPGSTITSFYPALVGMLDRMLLILTGDIFASQGLHAFFALTAAMSSGLLVRRIGFDISVATLAFLFFCIIKAVAAYGPTGMVDLALTAYCGLAIVLLLVWKVNPNNSLAVLLGLLMGGLLNTKYHGLALCATLGFFILCSCLGSLARCKGALIIFGVAALSILPLFLRNYWLTGNPVFPVFNPFFLPQVYDYALDINEGTRMGGGFIELIQVPWNMVMHPELFEGNFYGGPYLLIFAPLSILVRKKMALSARSLVMILIGYLTLWFYFMPQVVRMLIYVFPIVTAFASIGFFAVYRLYRENKIAITLLSCSSILVIVLQIGFFMNFVRNRVPVAIGITPTIEYLHATDDSVSLPDACLFLNKNLQPNEKYIALLHPLSYYCPQASAIVDKFPSEMTLIGKLKPRLPEEFVSEIDINNIRYIAVHIQRRSNPGFFSREDDLFEQVNVGAIFRYGDLIKQAINGINPVYSGNGVAIYDAQDIVFRLRATKN